jgi:DNA topoisomerase III
MTTYRHGLDIHEFQGSFCGIPALFRMTSVIGHVFALDFLPQFQSWEGTDPQKLFFAGTRKSEANPKVGQ